MKHVCTTCDQKFDDIPAGAVQLTPGERRINTFRFADGTIHSLRKVRGLTEGFHRRWHKHPKIGCEFCFPPPLPEPPREETQSVVEVSVELPEPDKVKQVVADGPEIEDVESATTMAAAFHRIFKS
jgi:hypothetical protein